jgi:hypothetical protein
VGYYKTKLICNGFNHLQGDKTRVRTPLICNYSEIPLPKKNSNRITAGKTELDVKAVRESSKQRGNKKSKREKE